MPIDRNKLEEIMADPDFMSLPENEQESFLDEMSETSQPSIMDKASQAMSIANPGFEAAKGIAKGYGAMRSGVQEMAKGVTPEFNLPYVQPKSTEMLTEVFYPTGKTPIDMLNPFSQSKPTNISSKKLASEGAGLAFDQVATLGALKGVPTVASTGKIMRPKNFSKITRSLAGIPSKSIKTLREIGPENVFKPELESESFIGKNLTPKVSNMIRKSMGIPEEEIASLESQYKGSTTPILEKIKSSLTTKTTSEEGRITKILQDTPNSKRIRLNEFRTQLTDSLTGLFKGGKLRKDIPKEDLKPIRELIDMYKDKRKVFDKTEFLRRRSRLIDLQQSPSGEVASKATILKDALDMDAEQFGISGLREAKGAYKTAKEMEGRFLNRNTGDFKYGESKLSKVGDSLPSQDMDALKELEAYIGQPFIDELSKVNKIRNISEQFSGTKIESLLKSAQKPENVQIKEQLKSILGENYAEVENLLTSNRIAQEFTPKGLFASRGGIIKGIARSGLKAYEESVRPKLISLMKRKK